MSNKISLDGVLQDGWTINIVTQGQPIPNPPPVQPPPPPVIPPPANGIVLPWDINSLMSPNPVRFVAGETKTLIARIANQVHGFDVIFYPMADFTVTGKMTFPPKPDGTPYKLVSGVAQRLAAGLTAGYDGSINLTIRTGSIVLEAYIYPGDFVITLAADKAGWGYLNTELYP